MNYKTLRGLALLAATAAFVDKSSPFNVNVGQTQEKEESPKDRERRERCERLAMEKAKAKRERKAAKIRLLTKKEE